MEAFDFFIVAKSLDCILHSLSMFLQELYALRPYVQFVIRNTVEQKEGEVGFVLFEVLKLHVLHPVEQYLVKFSSYIL